MQTAHFISRSVVFSSTGTITTPPGSSPTGFPLRIKSGHSPKKPSPVNFPYASRLTHMSKKPSMPLFAYILLFCLRKKTACNLFITARPDILDIQAATRPADKAGPYVPAMAYIKIYVRIFKKGFALFRSQKAQSFGPFPWNAVCGNSPAQEAVGKTCVPFGSRIKVPAYEQVKIIWHLRFLSAAQVPVCNHQLHIPGICLSCLWSPWTPWSELLSQHMFFFRKAAWPPGVSVLWHVSHLWCRYLRKKR